MWRLSSRWNSAVATGEPHQVCPVVCDIVESLTEVSFPIASPLVMSVARTFWEKATAAHVFCAQAASAANATRGIGTTWPRLP